MRTALLPLCLCLIPVAATAAVEVAADAVHLRGDGYDLAFSKANGSILSVTQAGVATPLWRSGEWGLWRLQFEGNATLSAADFSPGAADRAYSFTVDEGAGALRMTYEAPDAAVTVDATLTDGGIDLRARMDVKRGTLLTLSLPGRLRFSPETVARVVFPMNGNSSVGSAFNASFFSPQPTDHPAGWSPSPAGPAGYETLYGKGLNQRADNDEPVRVTVTAEGREWLGAQVADAVEGSTALVNRPCAEGQADITIADSPNGPYFCGSDLGGSGWLWRLGGRVGDLEAGNALRMVAAVMQKLANAPGQTRRKIGLLALSNGPERGGWANIPVGDWRRRLSAVPGPDGRAVPMDEISNPQAMLDALASGEYLAVLNPYGEWAPALEKGAMPQTVAAVQAYVHGGGSWFEVGGYPFYYEMLPLQYLKHSTAYPDGFSDFIHLDTVDDGEGHYAA